MREDTLPNSLHGLLQTAIKDIEKVLEEPNIYRVVMNYWHGPRNYYDEFVRCEVCMAGAVMAKSLGASRFEGKSPASYGGSLERKLNVIDRLRRFYFFGAYHELYGDMPLDLNDKLFALGSKYNDHPLKYSEDWEPGSHKNLEVYKEAQKELEKLNV